MQQIRMLGALLLCGLTLAGLVTTAAEGAGPPGANPDNRGYELVSLPDTAGASMYAGIANSDVSMRRPALAPGGGRVFVTSVLPIKDQPDAGLASSFTAVRTAGGWQRTYNGLPSRRSAYDSTGVPLAWSSDLETVLWATLGPSADPLDPSPARDGNGSVVGLLRQPIGATPVEQFNVPEFGSAFGAGPAIPAISDDGRSVVFTVPGGHLRTGDPDGTVYRRVADGPPQRVSVDTAGNPVAAFPKAVSDDAQDVVYELSTPGGDGNLLRRVGDAPAQIIDRDRTGGATPRGLSAMVASRADASVVYFVTRDRLLAQDTDSDSDLYRWTAAGDALTLVSRGAGGGGNGGAADCPTPLPSTQVDYSPQACDVAFVGADRAGETVYFLSPERLGGASGATPGGLNLYVRREGSADPRFLMTLDAGDTLPGVLSIPPPLGTREATVVGDGTLLVRTAADPAGGAPRSVPQLLRVDPDGGAALCVSCAPAGGSDGAAALGGGVEGIGQGPAENATSDGRTVFFESAGRLVPEDRNGKTDVYSYDIASGRASLVSTGADPGNTFLAGVSADGADVLLYTRATLVGEDRNGRTVKVYDARRDGGFPEPAPLALPCDGEGCRRPQVPASATADPPSFAFTGAGNRRAPTRLVAGTLSSRARALLATGAPVSLRVRASRAATVRVRGTARLGSRRITVMAATTRLRRAGVRSVRLRLSRQALKALRQRGRLTISIALSASGAEAPPTTTLTLRPTRKGSR